MRIDCLNQHALIQFSVRIISHFVSSFAIRTFIARHIIKITTHNETKRLANLLKITKKRQTLTCYICTYAAIVRHQASGAVISKYSEIISLRQQLGRTSVFNIHYGS